LPLIDVQERASGPELIGGNHERHFSHSGRNMLITYELLLQASIHRHCISNKAFWPLQRAAHVMLTRNTSGLAGVAIIYQRIPLEL
jgi:hypothetical protein